jgi:hypothetical protein
MTGPPRHLSYATEVPLIPTRALHLVALFCGIVPMTVGMLLLLGFWLTRWNAFAVVGFATLLAGSLCFLIGLTCLAI